jgi:hypothetical protein
MLSAILSSLAFAGLASAPGGPESLGFWSTCYSPTRCVSLSIFRSNAQSDDRHAFAAMLSSPDAFPVGESEFRVTGWGLFHPGAVDLGLLIDRSEDGWSGTPAGWEDFTFAIGTPFWEAALGGESWGEEGFLGHWKGAPAFRSMRFAWRGVTQDQSVTFDCIQSGVGKSTCAIVAQAPSSLRLMDSGLVAPEPSTVILLGTGLLVLVLGALRKR